MSLLAILHCLHVCICMACDADSYDIWSLLEPEFTVFGNNTLGKVWMSVTKRKKNSVDQREQMLERFNWTICWLMSALFVDMYMAVASGPAGLILDWPVFDASNFNTAHAWTINNQVRNNWSQEHCSPVQNLDYPKFSPQSLHEIFSWFNFCVVWFCPCVQAEMFGDHRECE